MCSDVVLVLKQGKRDRGWWNWPERNKGMAQAAWGLREGGVVWILVFGVGRGRGQGAVLQGAVSVEESLSFLL